MDSIAVPHVIQEFVRGPMCQNIDRAMAVVRATGTPSQSWNRREFCADGSSLLIQDYSPVLDLKLVEFIGEVTFPYHFDEVYSVVQNAPEALALAGLRIDPQGRPEAVIDLVHGSVGAHFATLSSIKPLVKILNTRLEVRRNTWTYDEQVERDNIVYHVERQEGRVPAELDNFNDQAFYAALRDTCAADLGPYVSYRDDYFVDGLFVGHSLWALNPYIGELYWVSPVQARNEQTRKLRVGNLMMLHALSEAYATGLKTVNLGVDEFDYKASFWNTRRIYKPGLRRSA